MRKSSAALIASHALILAACGSSSSSSTAGARSTSKAAAGAVVITTRDLPGLGTVLVNGQGRTLYTYAPDKDKRVTCVGGCASAWPPLVIAASQKTATSGAVNAALVASDPDPSGGRVVTYAGWPLYLYVADPAAGTAHGQSIRSAGGLWYVIAPSGMIVTKRPTVTKRPSAGGGGMTTSATGSASGGIGY